MSNDFIEAVPGLKAKMDNAIARALERCGSQAEGYAGDLCPVDTGNLKNSIAHTVVEQSAFIGTNVKYAPYVEYGTGSYATTGGGISAVSTFCRFHAFSP